MRHFTPRFLLLRLFSSLYNGVKPERHGSSDIVGSQTTFICKFRERHCNGLSKTKRAGTKATIRLPLLYPSYNNTCTPQEPQATPWANRGCLQICLLVRVLAFIERFYSRGRQLCKFIATKESLDQFRLLGNCPTTPPLVFLAAVFWMSRNAPPLSFGGALRDILKTTARETTPPLTHVEKYIKTSYLASLLLLRERA